MTCLHVDSLLSGSRDLPLTDIEQKIVDLHLLECPSCVRRMQGYVATCQLLKGLGTYEENETPPPVPETLIKRILAARQALVLEGIREQSRFG